MSKEVEIDLLKPNPCVIPCLSWDSLVAVWAGIQVPASSAMGGPISNDWELVLITN